MKKNSAPKSTTSESQSQRSSTSVNSIEKILIANRGEIAVRIIRTCQKLGIPTVAVYSDLDKEHPHVQLADEAYPLGGTKASESYLNIEKIISIAKHCGANAIHPGYGFLAENSDFAQSLSDSGMIFVGPNAETMRLAGQKHLARATARELRIPIPEGYEAENPTLEELRSAAQEIGFPLLIKAVSGGGGRGMRLVREASELAEAIESAKREAQAFFADQRVILEQYVFPARHIEVQLIGDSFGNVCHLFERDCSLQRRYQKVIEESPARFLATETREQMFAAATQLGQKLKLLGAGTVEFLVPAAAQDQRANFYFLEINPRIQVEHPVTELVTGFDIVELQIRVARGEPLPFHQEQVRQIGSAIEARVCAEIPKQNFRPSGGKLSILDIPAPITTSKTNSVRFDHGLAQGISIPTEYDSLLLKAIAHGSNSIQAREELIRALSGLAIYRVETNIHFLLQLLRHQDFLEEPPITTDFIDRQPELFISPLPTEESAQIARIALSAYLALEPRLFQMAINKEIGRTERRREANLTSIARGPLRNFLIRCSAFATEQILRSRIQSEEYHEKGDLLRYFVDFLDSNAELDIRNNPLRLGQPFLIQLNKRTQSLTLLEHSLNDNLDIDATFLLEGLQIKLSRQINDCNDSLKISKASEVYAPLPGTVLKVLVKAGSPVQLGDTLLVLESMKMEHALHSPCNGIVAEIRIAQGDKVKDGDLLIRFTERT